MLNKLYEHCKSDVGAKNNKEFRRALQCTVKCDICDMCCKILHSPFLIHRRVPSESDISRYIQACRASAIYGIAIYWRYTHKRVPALVFTRVCVCLLHNLITDHIQLHYSCKFVLHHPLLRHNPSVLKPMTLSINGHHSLFKSAFGLNENLKHVSFQSTKTL